PKSSREKVKAYRERMRRRGMKLIQIWVPDPESPYFFAEARRQARLIAESPHEKDDQAFIDSISEWKPD
ncbi:MAG TPA: antitoxin MazE family protein, partial [Xanthobacteraceae bacterium]